MVTKLTKLLLLPLAILLCTSCDTRNTPSSNTDTSSGQEEETRIMHDEPVYTEIDAIPFDKSYWEAPQYYFDETLDNQGCKAVFIRSDYNNQESYAFAYLGIPNEPLEGKPAILLVHGGGGSAYYEWVNAWVAKGYVALAIDLEGHIPNKEGTIGDGPAALYHNSTYVAPHNQNLGDENADVTLIWLHYACRTCIIANSFLHHYAGVDPYKIGVCGVSWGGYITSIIAGYDDRFAFAIPYYCTTDMLNDSTPIKTFIQSHRSFEIFDNPEPLKHVDTPFFYIGSNSDQYSNIKSAPEVCASMKNGYVSILDRFLHSHANALSSIESFVFADNVLAHKEKLILKFVDQNNLSITIPESRTLLEGSIYYTLDEEVNKDTKWRSSSLGINNLSTSKVINTTIREGAHFYYASVIDEKGAVYTTKIEKIN